jgi:hypothetical protein
VSLFIFILTQGSTSLGKVKCKGYYERNNEKKTQGAYELYNEGNKYQAVKNYLTSYLGYFRKEEKKVLEIFYVQISYSR